MRAAAFLLGTIAVVNLPAQTAGMGSPPTAGIPASAGAIPNESGPSRADNSRPIYISGKVAMEDGSAVPQNISIQRVCGGISKTVANTDSKGRFGFQWEDRSLTVTDAADAGTGPSGRAGSSGFGGAQSTGGSSALAADPFGSRMMNCELRASLAGFTSDSIALINRRPGDTPDVGLIVLHRIGGVEGLSISLTSMLAPKNARKAYERGLQSRLKNRPAEAAKDFEKAVAIYPKYADAWVSLGKLRLEQQSVAPARAALLKAMDADPKLITPYVELGLLAARDANWQESGRYLDRAVALDPVDLPQAWYADAVAHYNLKNYDAAEKSARAAVKLDPRHANPRSEYLLGLVLAEKKDYAGAAGELATYLKLAPNAPDLAQAKEQLAQFEKLKGGAR